MKLRKGVRAHYIDGAKVRVHEVTDAKTVDLLRGFLWEEYGSEDGVYLVGPNQWAVRDGDSITFWEAE